MQPQHHLGKAESRILDRNPHLAGQRDFEAAAEAEAVDHSDTRNAQRLEAMPDWDAAIPFVKVPVLLICARDDATKPFEDVDELLAALEGSELCKLHVVGSGGHFGLFDTAFTPEGETTALPGEVRMAAAAMAGFVRAALLANDGIEPKSQEQRLFEETVNASCFVSGQ